MLSLPSSLAVVGLVPGIIVIVFLGVFGLFTAWILIQFKLRHPEGKIPWLLIRCSSLEGLHVLKVHNMGDAGQILFGPLGREVLSFGTIVFAIFATGGQLLAGQIALGSVSQTSENVLFKSNLTDPSSQTANSASCSTQASSPSPRSSAPSHARLTACLGSASLASSVFS